MSLLAFDEGLSVAQLVAYSMYWRGVIAPVLQTRVFYCFIKQDLAAWKAETCFTFDEKGDHSIYMGGCAWACCNDVALCAEREG